MPRARRGRSPRRNASASTAGVEATRLVERRVDAAATDGVDEAEERVVDRGRDDDRPALVGEHPQELGGADHDVGDDHRRGGVDLPPPAVGGVPDDRRGVARTPPVAGVAAAHRGRHGIHDGGAGVDVHLGDPEREHVVGVRDPLHARAVAAQLVGAGAEEGCGHDRNPRRGAPGRARRDLSGPLTVSVMGTDATQPQVSSRVLTVPNALSALRLVGVPVFLWAILTERDTLAIVLLVASGITDYLDGKIARHVRPGLAGRAAARPRSPTASTSSRPSLGLAWREIIPWWLVAVLLARELFMAVVVLVAKRHGWVGLPVHFAGKAATFNLLFAFPLLLLAEGDGAWARIAEPVGWAFVWWGTALYWVSGILYALQLRHLLARPPGGARRERLRPPPERRPDASMTLLTTMLERPLDPGYAAAADRRAAAGMPRATSLRSPRLAVACILIGLLVGVASYNLTAGEHAALQGPGGPHRPDRGPAHPGRRADGQGLGAPGRGDRARGGAARWATSSPRAAVTSRPRSAPCP